MRFEGKIVKSGEFWHVEVPILGVMSQGETREEAYLMIADAIESLVNKAGFKVDVYPGGGESFEVGAQDQATLHAFLLKRLRIRHGLTMSEAAKRLGAKSINAYARYEQGKSVPSIETFDRLLRAVSPGRDFILSEG